MKHIQTIAVISFLFIFTYTTYSANQTDSLPSYYSSDKKFFSFTVSTNTFMPRSEKVCLYKILKNDSLIEQYWITNNHLIKLKAGEADFLSMLLTKDTATLDQIRSQYNLAEESYSARFDTFFQIQLEHIKQKTGSVYGCGQDRKGHKTTFNKFTLEIKRDGKVFFSKKFQMSAPKISEFEQQINGMTVFLF